MVCPILTYIENLYRTSPDDYFCTWQICHSKFNPKLPFCNYTMTYSCIEWLFTVKLPEHQEESCSKQVLYLKSWWMQQNSNPKPLNLWTNAYLISSNGQMIDMSVLQERSFVSVIYLLSHKLINEKFKFTNLALNFKIYSANGPQFIKFIFWGDLWKCNCNKWIRDTISDKLWNTFNCKLHGKLFFSQSQLWICLNFIEIVAEIWNPSGCNWIWPHYILITLLNYLTILCKPIIVHSQTQWLLV